MTNITNFAEARAKQAEKNFRVIEGGHTEGPEDTLVFTDEALGYYQKWFNRFGLKVWSGMPRNQFRKAIVTIHNFEYLRACEEFDADVKAGRVGPVEQQMSTLIDEGKLEEALALKDAVLRERAEMAKVLPIAQA